MIINTGQRTDIPAFYSPWFLKRLEEGYVMVRNPFSRGQVTCLRLDPRVVDLICFCTKNPGPLLPHMEKLSSFRQLWHVTITPYGRDMEPFVPPVREAISAFRALSDITGPSRICWRNDPILLTDVYPLSFHIRAFSYMAEALEGYTHTCIFSFLDLYRKTVRNFPEGRRVSHEDQWKLTGEMVEIGRQHGMKLVSCLEDPALASLGADTTGCLTKEKVEKAIGLPLKIPSYEKGPVRKGCACLLGHDIGAYSSCLHGCRYCYANESRETVLANRRNHDPDSPFLIGGREEGDEIREARQESWINREVSLF